MTLEGSESDPNATLALVATPNGDFLAVEGDLVTAHLQRFGGHTRPHVALLRSLADEGSRILDVGAHIGSFSVPLGLVLRETGHLWSFEPDQESFALLRMNLALNGLTNRTTAVPAAVSDSSQRLFSVAPDESNTGATYLVNHPSEETPRESIPALSIDELMADGALDGADLIKIDVEGMETQVLRGARATLMEYRPYLFIEVSPAQLARHGSSPRDIEAMLIELGYTFFVPLGPRNRASDEVTLEELGTLSDRDEILFDVLAVPETRALPSVIFPLSGDAA